MKNKIAAWIGLFMCSFLIACGSSDSSVSVANDEVVTSQVSDSETSSTVSHENPEDRDEEFSVSEDLMSVTLGKYEQDNDLQNGTEAIEWIVIDKVENKALVISKYVLDCQPYSRGYAECTWETSSIRSWLNSDFLNAAFSEGEQARIIKTFVPDVNPELTEEVDSSKSEDGTSVNQETEGEITGTEDLVFLLSDFELLKYLSNTDSIEGDEPYAKATEYAKAQGVWTMTEAVYNVHKDDKDAFPESVGCGWWWLRSYIPDADGKGRITKALDVDSLGNIRVNGHDVGESHDGVRPAMWIILD